MATIRVFSAALLTTVALVLLYGATAEAKKGADDYRPLLTQKWGDLAVEVPVLFAGRVEGVSAFKVDKDGTLFDVGTGTDLQLRVGLKAKYLFAPMQLTAEYEQDVFSAAPSGDPELPGEQMPYSREMSHALRKASLRASFGRYLHLQGGFTTSHWGLGLIANDGAHGWAPRNALFSDPRGGDRVVRLLAATGPLTKWGVLAAVAFDWVQEDEILLDDDAKQIVGSLRVGYGKPHGAGVYVVHRMQEAADGDETNVTVVDLHAYTQFALSRRWKVSLEGEGAVIFGSTGLGSSVSAPEKDVMQMAGALRLGLHGKHLGMVIDFVYTSGDRNFDDDQQNNFRSDPNFQLSLLAHQHIMAAQSGRAPISASNPDIVGYPNEDLERLPTRGGLTNTIAIFPRSYLHFKKVEFYWGPMFAFTEVDLADPFNNRVAGGSPRNALNGKPGSYLGTEIDVGLRYRDSWAGTELVIGIEGGVFFPGSALNDPAEGEAMDNVWGGRALLQYRL